MATFDFCPNITLQNISFQILNYHIEMFVKLIIDFNCCLLTFHTMLKPPLFYCCLNICQLLNNVTTNYPANRWNSKQHFSNNFAKISTNPIESWYVYFPYVIATLGPIWRSHLIFMSYDQLEPLVASISSWNRPAIHNCNSLDIHLELWKLKVT